MKMQTIMNTIKDQLFLEQILDFQMEVSGIQLFSRTKKRLKIENLLLGLKKTALSSFQLLVELLADWDEMKVWISKIACRFTWKVQSLLACCTVELHEDGNAKLVADVISKLIVEILQQKCSYLFVAKLLAQSNMVRHINSCMKWKIKWCYVILKSEKLKNIKNDKENIPISIEWLCQKIGDKLALNDAAQDWFRFITSSLRYYALRN